jgi:CHAD domain-containing protein
MAEGRFFTVPSKLSVQQVCRELQKMGYRYSNEGIRRLAYLYYDTQDGKLLNKGYRLRYCEIQSGKEDGSTDSSISRQHRIWHLIRRGELILSQPVPDGAAPSQSRRAAISAPVPGNGVIADHLLKIADLQELLPFLQARMSEQSMLIVPPHVSHDGVRSLPDGAAPFDPVLDDARQIRLQFQNWSFKNPLQNTWSRRPMLAAITTGVKTADASYLMSLLRDYVGLTPVSFDPLAQGLDAVNAPLPGAPVPARYLLTADDSTCTAIGKIIGRQVFKMWGNTEGTLHDLHPEYLHDLRVATRRLRFALNLFKDTLDGEVVTGLRKELSWVAKGLGKVRDIDVFQEKFTEQFREIVATDSVISAVETYYRGRRDRSLDKMKEALLSERYRKLLDRLHELERDALKEGGATVVEKERVQNPGRMLITAHIPVIIESALKKMDKWLDRSAQSLTAEDLHELRIEFKGLRYTTEFFSELYAPAMRKLIRGFVRFQDCLGLHQDAQIATETLRGFSEKMMRGERPPLEVLLGAGSLLQVQRQIQERERKRFLAMWHKFPGQVKELRKLLKSGKFYDHV